MNEATEVLPRQTPQIKFSESDKERFWGKVNKIEDGCWEWAAGLSNKGYGKFTLNNKTLIAHRVSWLFEHGEPPKDGMCVCHKCDNRKCVNPSHLFIGSHQDNVDDMISKGRKATGDSNGARRLFIDIRLGKKSHKNSNPNCLLKGSSVGTSKLTAENVKFIRHEYAFGRQTPNQLAELFGLGRSQVSRIIKNESWGHVEHTPVLDKNGNIRKPDYLTFVEELFRWG
jgi:hypothetical protein